MKTEPHVILDEDFEDLSLDWYFGPQGHPASMVVTVVMLTEKQLEPRLWVILNKSKEMVQEKLNLKRLGAFLIYGHKITDEFGEDNFWHRCDSESDNHHYKCAGCMEIKSAEKKRATEWFKLNPLPVNSKQQENPMPYRTAHNPFLEEIEKKRIEGIEEKVEYIKQKILIAAKKQYKKIDIAIHTSAFNVLCSNAVRQRILDLGIKIERRADVYIITWE